MPTTINGTQLTYPDGTTQSTAIFGLGTNQTWQDLTASRAAGTTYTNSTSLPIAISVVLTAGNGDARAHLTIDGIKIQEYLNNTNGTTIAASLSAIVPAGSTYSITIVSLFTVNKWFELR
jgi:hypothetical protein